MCVNRVKDRLETPSTVTPSQDSLKLLLSYLAVVLVEGLLWSFGGASMFIDISLSMHVMVWYEAAMLFLAWASVAVQAVLQCGEPIASQTRLEICFYVEASSDLLAQSLNVLHYLHLRIVFGHSLGYLGDIIVIYKVKAAIAAFVGTFNRLHSHIVIRRLVDKYLENAIVEPHGSEGGDTCVICRELMTRAKRLPCGHIFHLTCLRRWLEADVTCPVCRAVCLSEADARTLRQLRGIRPRELVQDELTHFPPRTDLNGPQQVNDAHNQEEWLIRSTSPVPVPVYTSPSDEVSGAQQLTSAQWVGEPQHSQRDENEVTPPPDCNTQREGHTGTTRSGVVRRTGIIPDDPTEEREEMSPITRRIPIHTGGDDATRLSELEDVSSSFPPPRARRNPAGTGTIASAGTPGATTPGTSTAPHPSPTYQTPLRSGPRTFLVSIPASVSLNGVLLFLPLQGQATTRQRHPILQAQLVNGPHLINQADSNSKLHQPVTSPSSPVPSLSPLAGTATDTTVNVPSTAVTTVPSTALTSTPITSTPITSTPVTSAPITSTSVERVSTNAERPSDDRGSDDSGVTSSRPIEVVSPSATSSVAPPVWLNPFTSGTPLTSPRVTPSPTSHLMAATRVIHRVRCGVLSKASVPVESQGGAPVDGAACGGAAGELQLPRRGHSPTPTQQIPPSGASSQASTLSEVIHSGGPGFQGHLPVHLGSTPFLINGEYLTALPVASGIIVPVPQVLSRIIMRLLPIFHRISNCFRRRPDRGDSTRVD
eukprot:GHVN01013813.1.p1 GENE.GHVN01013813.1~~GHVN01013813.1.p1  ORF type:complete len:765 (+),score=155.17 GHVN01013813.1:3144-5438(+)